MMLLSLLAAAACLPVSGPTITAKDVAAAVPGYVARDGAPAFGFAPTPGVVRSVHATELRQYLDREQYQGPVPTGNVCYARPMAVLSEAAVKSAMQSVLGADAKIDVVELSRFPAPLGTPVFDRRDIGNPPIAFWRGYVPYDGDKKFPVWARVKLSVHTTRLIALEDLRPGAPIRPEQVDIETAEDFPASHVTPASVNQVIGALPRRFINAHTPVWEDAIDPPNQITKGDRVNVTVHSGRARLSFDAEAETSGRSGEMVSFKNPESGKVFRARVAGPDQAMIETPGSLP